MDLSPRHSVRKQAAHTIPRAICLCLGLFALISSPVPCAGEEIRTIATRPGVTLDILLLKPAIASNRILVMFPGARGAKQFRAEGGKIRLGKNFLVRTAPEFVRKGLAVAVVDTPSDHRSGMEDGFRMSPEHRDDISQAVLFLAGQGYDSIYLVGTSKGTISAAYLGEALKNEHIRGIALTSSMGYNRFLAWLPLEKVTYPVLIVHHKHDRCAVTSYSEALTLKEKLTASPKVDFVAVDGGSAPQSDPCEPMSAHGYLGIEMDVVAAICDWVARTPASPPR